MTEALPTTVAPTKKVNSTYPVARLREQGWTADEIDFFFDKAEFTPRTPEQWDAAITAQSR